MSAQPRRKRRGTKILYSRELPGGGYVTIQTELSEDASYRGWISVERRSDLGRRDGNAVPVIAEMFGVSADLLYTSLHEIASDNVAVASAIIRWESENLKAAQ